MRKQLTALILMLVMLLCITGCDGPQPTAKPGNVEITMYLWDKSMTKELTPWLEKQFPDIRFTFVVGYNTMAYYTDLTDRGADMPDIITCRRFSLNDAAHMSDQLLDLSQTEIVGTFYSSYIENNRETDGAIRWLPMCAEVDGYLANLDLFSSYNVPIPTNYAEFVEAINTFEAEGITGFTTDWNADYTCLETMQGVSIPQLMSLEGTMWRREYESATNDSRVGLDDKVWPGVFRRYEQFLKDIRMQPEEASQVWNSVSGPFREGKIAMMRGTANDCVITNKLFGMNCAMLPYFGETSQDNWILTYPMCQLAVAEHVSRDEAKQAAIMRVLDAIFSEEGQRRLASGAAVLSYNRTVNIEMDDALRYVADCIESNHMYMRLASTEIFTISRNVAQKMMSGEYSAQQAYDAFNEQLITPKPSADDEVLITQETAYPYTFGEHGSPAASSLLNTMRTGTGDEIAIGYSNVVSSPIFTGDYTLQQLKWLMTFKTVVYRGQYTGSEVRRIMDWLVNVKPDGSNPVRHYNNIPVTSGMEYTVTDNGDGTYTLVDITVNGKPLEDDTVYEVLLLGEDSYLEDKLYCNCPMPEDLKAKREEQHVSGYNSYDCMLDGVKACGQLIEPTDYVTVLH
ncbi:MAG: 5'-nucleotidase C-terminal domain-containing protein [Firmicutes bacterium]|nr:5'-nucleotidase C-terminal domain-containing protein [Bacillota bacterium]